MFERPGRTFLRLAPALVLTFALSAVGGDSTTPSDGLRYWVAALGWAGFAALVVVTALYAVVLGVRRIARRLPTVAPIERIRP